MEGGPGSITPRGKKEASKIDGDGLGGSGGTPMSPAATRKAEQKQEKERKKKEMADRKIEAKVQKQEKQAAKKVEPAKRLQAVSDSPSTARGGADVPPARRPVKFSSSNNLRRARDNSVPVVNSSLASSSSGMALPVDDESWATSDEVVCVLVGCDHAGKTSLLKALKPDYDGSQLFGSVTLANVAGSSTPSVARTSTGSSDQATPTASTEQVGSDQGPPLTVVDTEASDAFSRLRALNYEVADCFVLVHSLFDEDQLDDITSWYYPEVALLAADRPVFLLGTRSAAMATPSTEAKKKKKSKREEPARVSADLIAAAAKDVSAVASRMVDITSASDVQAFFSTVIQAVVSWRLE